MPLWMNADGILIANESGILIDCDECPCDPCAGTLDAYGISFPVSLEDPSLSAGPEKTEYTYSCRYNSSGSCIGQTYLLDRELDPAPATPCLWKTVSANIQSLCESCTGSSTYSRLYLSTRDYYSDIGWTDWSSPSTSSYDFHLSRHVAATSYTYKGVSFTAGDIFWIVSRVTGGVTPLWYKLGDDPFGTYDLFPAESTHKVKTCTIS